jgi:hypothetical protein
MQQRLLSEETLSEGTGEALSQWRSSTMEFQLPSLSFLHNAHSSATSTFCETEGL